MPMYRASTVFTKRFNFTYFLNKYIKLIYLFKGNKVNKKLMQAGFIHRQEEAK